ncbi:PAS domain-containing protein [Undibacterium sp. Di27W]|uniref:PAS domain-containing hybrid sensor histidine kinase/response regulator n=1 Tax=Undibacterium sp. Di27W TaxID=3413036 RepID=UPI003BF07215
MNDIKADDIDGMRLRQSEERLRLATEFAEIGFWDVDMIVGQLTWPPTVKAMFGISPDVSVSMDDFYAGLHPEDRESTGASFAAACDPQQRALYDVEYRTVGKEDGVVRWVAAKGRSIFDEHGRCLRVIGTAIDISARKRAESALRESEARLRAVTENANVGLVVVDCDHRYRFANRAYNQILGLSTSDLVGSRVCDVLPDVYDDQIRPRLDQAFAGQTVIYELTIPSDETRRRRKYAVTYEPGCQNDGTAIVIVVIYDVTEREFAKEEAERSRRLLEAFIEAVPGVVYAKDLQGRMLLANHGLSENIGKPPEEYLGKTDAQFLNDSKQAAIVMANDQRVMNSGVMEQVEEGVRRPDGTDTVWLSTKAPLRNDLGELIGLIGSSIDITSRKLTEAALSKSEAALRMFADAIPTLAWRAHADGWIFWYNQRWYEYTGTTPPEMEGWGWEKVHDPATLMEVKTRWTQSIATGTIFEMTFPLRGADGEFRPFLTRVVPIRDADGCITQWFGTNTDISSERAILSKLEVSEKRLRDADRRKDIFLAILAHELRNPLAPIRSAASILASPKLESKQLTWVSEVIQRQVKHMGLLLDDLLDVARITQDKLELKAEEIALSSIVDSAVETVRPLFLKKNHQFILDVPIDDTVMLHGDPLRLAQILSNLLTNAAKYTADEGRIELSAKVDHCVLRLSVKDNGLGIAPESLTDIFTIFSQVEEAAQRSEGGLGIGLALAKGLAEMHGGTVEVHSAGLGTGSEFIVTLPIVLPPAEVTQDSPTSTTAAIARRILVADDNEDAATMLGCVIELAGHEVNVVYGGKAAFSAARDLLPDVAIIDIGMPDMDGYQVAQAIRSQSWGTAVNLIALTGWGQEEDKRRTALAGFDEHLTKPVDTTQLLSIISSFRSNKNIST